MAIDQRVKDETCVTDKRGGTNENACICTYVRWELVNVDALNHSNENRT